MSAIEKSEDGQTISFRHLGTNEALLRSEIGFWKEMIDSNGPTHVPATIERMEQALALAESRLAELFEALQFECEKEPPGSGNVYFIRPSGQAE